MRPSCTTGLPAAGTSPGLQGSLGQDEPVEVGRYLEPQARPDGTLEVDFNYAYNPFCAYGTGWSCPIPPEENRLAVTIAAGEKAFRDPAEKVAGTLSLSD